MSDFDHFSIVTGVIATNKKAFHDYFVEDRFECGIALFGTEVKSMRQGKVNLKESWAQVRDGEVWVEGMHISPFEQGNIFNKDPLRTRKLLMHKRLSSYQLTLSVFCLQFQS